MALPEVLAGGNERDCLSGRELRWGVTGDALGLQCVFWDALRRLPPDGRSLPQ